MHAPPWQFFIDVGGTFTDVVARRPDETIITYKLLSSGAIRGQCDAGSSSDCIVDPRRIGEPRDLWVGFRVAILDADNQSRIPPEPRASARADALDQYRDGKGAGLSSSCVTAFDPTSGRIHLNQPLPTAPRVGTAYELSCADEAPVVAIRLLMGLKLAEKYFFKNRQPLRFVERLALELIFNLWNNDVHNEGPNKIDPAQNDPIVGHFFQRGLEDLEDIRFFGNKPDEDFFDIIR